jgi:hypothetical protein
MERIVMSDLVAGSPIQHITIAVNNLVSQLKPFLHHIETVITYSCNGHVQVVKSTYGIPRYEEIHHSNRNIAGAYSYVDNGYIAT